MLTIESPQELTARIRQLFVDRIGEHFRSVPAEADLRQALGDAYGSLTATECIYAIEETFKVEVDFVADDVRYWFASLERMGQFVAQRLEDAAA